MSRRPSLFVVGAPKCGTTALTRYLEAHPAVFMAPRKDIHFFGSDLDFRNRSRESEADYLARFADAGEGMTLAESSVWYLASTQAAAEIAAFNPNARAVVMLRHPVDAMYALWGQLRLNGLGDEDLTDFAEALAAEPERARGARIPADTPLPSALLYRRAVRFSDQLERYQEALGREAVYVIIQEEMRADTAATVAAVYRWLGVDPSFSPELKPVNTAKAVRSEGLRSLLRAAPAGVKDVVPLGLRRRVSRQLRRWNSRHEARAPMDPRLRAALVEEFSPEVARIEALLGRRVPAWIRS